MLDWHSPDPKSKKPMFAKQTWALDFKSADRVFAGLGFDRLS